MSGERNGARGELGRMMRLIAVLAAFMVAGALWLVSLFGPLNPVTIGATVGGVFLSTLLGCGLFALAFYSSKSGHDERSRDATDRRPG